LALKNGMVLITGASSGIGFATTQLMARSALQVILVGRNQTRLQALAAEFGATPVVADITNHDEVKQVAEFVQRQVGRLDVLINCAGQLEVGPAECRGVEIAEHLMRVNFLGAVAMIDACLPLLRQANRASIVNVSSLAGRLAPPYMAAYAASKFALSGYSHALRQELRPEGIHVGLVLPGPVDTPMVDGKLGETYYPHPPGLPLLTADQVARGIARVVERRIPEAILPRRADIFARLVSAFPRLADYYFYVARQAAKHRYNG
jgi:short-subunit dehydrogenase